MGFIDIITKLFGNKSQKDMKAVMPYVDKIKAVYAEIDALSDDDLRARSALLMQRLQDAVADNKSKIIELKAGIEELEIDQREKVYNEIDHLQKQVLDIYDKTLMDILPDAFAIVKSTARRFAQNETIEVTATSMDRDLAADPRFDFVEIEGDKAIYHNSWTAGGNEVVWDMVHYDVQLIGGIVLHEGKIAEMATGEGKTPPNYTMYDKYYLGWKQPVNPGNTAQELTMLANQGYQLASSNSLLSATSTNTVYYIENRQNNGWDAALPGHGMLIWKIKYKVGGNI